MKTKIDNLFILILRYRYFVINKIFETISIGNKKIKNHSVSIIPVLFNIIAKKKIQNIILIFLFELLKCIVIIIFFIALLSQ